MEENSECLPKVSVIYRFSHRLFYLFKKKNNKKFICNFSDLLFIYMYINNDCIRFENCKTLSEVFGYRTTLTLD